MLNRYYVIQSTVTILIYWRLYSIHQLKNSNHENFKQ